MASFDQLAAVRIQDGLHGLSAENGSLILRHGGETARNTLHFSLNGAVGDHAYGSFNQDAQGNLKGSVAIVAPLAEMPVPAGFNQVDTWFRMDAKPSPDGGSPERSLNVGRAIVVAPAGSEIPQGVNAIFYEGGIAERDQAVAQACARFGVEAQPITAMRAWPGFTEGHARDWAAKTSVELYGEKAASIHCDMHDSSVDADLERLDSRGLIESLRHERFTVDESGAEIKLSDLAARRAEEGRRAIDAFLASLPPGEADRLQAQCDWQKGRLEADAVLAAELDQEWAASAEAAFEFELAQNLESLPGQGDFFVARAGDTAATPMNAQAMAEALLRSDIASDDRIWRSGMAADWAPAGSSPVAAAALAGGIRLSAREMAPPAPPPPVVAPPPPPAPAFAAAPAFISEPSPAAGLLDEAEPSAIGPLSLNKLAQWRAARAPAPSAENQPQPRRLAM